MDKKAEKVMCIKDGVIQEFNDYFLSSDQVARLKQDKLDDPDWDANRARGLEALIDIVKDNDGSDRFANQFKVRYDMGIGQDVLEAIELWNGSKYEFYVQYEGSSDDSI